MAKYRVRFERQNFGYSPPLIQISDVAFETDIPFDDEHIEKFVNAAWRAMWKQNPHWKNPYGPCKGDSGWCSVGNDGKYEKIPNK